MGTGSPADEAEVSAAWALVTAGLIDRQTDVTRGVRRRLATEIVELRGDPALVELLGASVEGNIDTIFHALRYEIPLDNVEPPTAALEYARRMAQRGVPMNAVVRAYRLGHGMVLDVAAEEIRNCGLDPRMSFAVLERMTPVTFHYIDWISQHVVDVYEDERDRWLANRNSVRTLRVRDVLESTDTDAAAITAAIRYPMLRTHLAAVLWQPPIESESRHDDDLARMELFLRELSESLVSQGSPLFVAVDRTSGWGWIPLPSAATAGAVEVVRRFVAGYHAPPRIALGTPLSGVEGFRRSHRQARRAHDLAIAAGAGGVIAAGDPGLAAASLMGENLDEARQWVHEVLGPLACDTDGDARLRETLRVFLRHGCSYTAAADELTLHFNSVKYRVGKATNRRGRPIDADRLDVELALLLCQWFGASVLQGPTID
jgi:GGDEF-like domain/PucR C-terminal helix-turn-helix domain